MAGPPPSDRARALAEQRRARNPTDPCDITQRVDLVGVRVEGLSGLRLNMKLVVTIRSEGPYSALVCCIPDSDQPVGALAAFPGLSVLLKCVEQGVVFEARVVYLAATRCTVVVSRKLT